MNKIWRLVAALALGAVCVGAIAPRAYAQDDPRDKKITLSLNDADVRDALKALFKNVGVQYSIAPEVQGTVVVELKDVPFETALRNILDQVKATYRVVGGVYEIVMRETAPPPTGGGSGTEPGAAAPTKPVKRFKIVHGDPYAILMLLMGTSPPWPEVSAVINGGSNGNGNGYGGNGYGNGGNYGGGNGGFGGGGFGGGGFGGGGFGGGSGGFGGGGFGGGGFGGGRF